MKIKTEGELLLSIVDKMMRETELKREVATLSNKDLKAFTLIIKAELKKRNLIK